MTEYAILGKLKQELERNIATESEVVYILVEIRKFIELTDSIHQYARFIFTVLGLSTLK